jgi:hypothetical protein
MSIFEEQHYQISLNKTNFVEGTNSTFRYQFPGSVEFKDAKIALAKTNTFFSWFNITVALGNNTFSYTFTDGSGTTTTPVTIPDGYYSVGTLNAYLQSIMVSNGEYLVDGDGNFVYYLEIVENASLYSVQVNAFAFPTALPAGYTNPNALTFPVTAQTTQLIVPATTFQDLIGFTAATYPASIQTATVSFTSDFTPQINPISSLFLTVNLVQNFYQNPNNILYTFTSGDTAFGGLITEAPSEYLWLDVQPGFYNEVEVTFLDQLYRQLVMRDTDIVVQLVFRTKK